MVCCVSVSVRVRVCVCMLGSGGGEEEVGEFIYTPFFFAARTPNTSQKGMPQCVIIMSHLSTVPNQPILYNTICRASPENGGS